METVGCKKQILWEILGVRFGPAVVGDLTVSQALNSSTITS